MVPRQLRELHGDLPRAAGGGGDQHGFCLPGGDGRPPADAGAETPPSCSMAMDAVSPEVSSATAAGDASGTGTTSFAGATAYSLKPP